MNGIPKPQEIYRHFKGNLYQIITLAEDSETGEELVIYQALYGEFKVYARPLEMFTSKVDKAKYPDAAQEYRFELQKRGAGASDVVCKAGAECKSDAVCDSNTACKSGSKTKEMSDVVDSFEEANPLKEEKMAITAQNEEFTLDPLVWEFLDADSHEQRLNILAALHHRITDDMITTMAVACDVEVPDGDVEERYSQLKNCLIMLDRFEIKRK